jgi:hypothetical protein
MRAYGAPPIDIPGYPDTVHRILLTGGSSAQAMDWGSTLSQLARFTGATTSGAVFALFVNLVSTHAAVPSSGSSVTTGTSANSTGNNLPVGPDPNSRLFQIPAWSTGFSVAAYTSGFAIVEVWKR